MPTIKTDTKRNIARRAATLRKRGLHWAAQATQFATVFRGDLGLALFVQWNEGNQRYLALALESGADPPDVGSVLADHAHDSLGEFGSEMEAKEECLAYALRWLLEEGEAERCDCPPIATPEGTD